jgi:hypothetical protein
VHLNNVCCVTTVFKKRAIGFMGFHLKKIHAIAILYAKLILMVLFIWGGQCLPLIASDAPVEIQKEALVINVDEKSIVFSWKADVRCALVKINNYWYLIFDAVEKNINLPRERYYPEGLMTIKLLREGDLPTDAMVYQLELLDSHEPYMELREKTKWVLSARLKNTLTPVEIPQKIKGFHEKWPMVSFSNLQSPKTITITDPETSVKALVIATAQSDNGHQEILTTPYVESLPSTQGIGVKLIHDKVSLSQKEDVFSLTCETDLKPLLFQTDPVEGFELSQYNVFREGRFWDYKLQLADWDKKFRDIEKSEIPAMNLLRAWIEIINADETKTLTFLELASDHHKGYQHITFYRFAKAIALLLKGDYDNAISILNNLSQTPEVKLWKAVATASKYTPYGYLNILRRADEVYGVYPDTIKNELGERVLLLLLDMKEAISAEVLYENLKYLKAKTTTGVYDYISASIRSHNREKIEGYEMLEALASDKKIITFPPNLRSRILYDLANVSFDLKKIRMPEYIKRLDAISLLVRNDPHGYNVYADLIDAQSKEKKFIEALKNLSTVGKYYSERFKGYHLDRKMEKLLLDYYAQDLKLVSPIKVIAVFEEFKDFLPEDVGESKIVKAVIAAMMNLDLLDQAAELLNKIVLRETNLRSRHDLIFQVATIHIHNRQPDSALATLNQIDDEMTDDESEEFKRIKALAYHFSGDNEKATEILLETTSIKNRLLLGDLYLFSKNWKGAKTAFHEVIPKLEEKSDTLGKENAVLKAAIAYYLDGDLDGNTQIGILYRDFMKDSKKAEIFDVVTKGQTLVPTNRQELAEVLSSIVLIQKSVDYIKNIN